MRYFASIILQKKQGESVVYDRTLLTGTPEAVSKAFIGSRETFKEMFPDNAVVYQDTEYFKQVIMDTGEDKILAIAIPAGSIISYEDKVMSVSFTVGPKHDSLNYREDITLYGRWHKLGIVDQLPQEVAEDLVPKSDTIVPGKTFRPNYMAGDITKAEAWGEYSVLRSLKSLITKYKLGSIPDNEIYLFKQGL